MNKRIKIIPWWAIWTKKIEAIKTDEQKKKDFLWIYQKNINLSPQKYWM